MDARGRGSRPDRRRSRDAADCWAAVGGHLGIRLVGRQSRPRRWRSGRDLAMDQVTALRASVFSDVTSVINLGIMLGAPGFAAGRPLRTGVAHSRAFVRCSGRGRPDAWLRRPRRLRLTSGRISAVSRQPACTAGCGCRARLRAISWVHICGPHSDLAWSARRCRNAEDAPPGIRAPKPC